MSRTHFSILSIIFLFCINSQAQTVSTIGTGVRGPCGIAADASGNVYVADRGGNPQVGGVSYIKKITPAGVMSNYSQNNTEYMYPHGIALSTSGLMYIADYRHIDKLVQPGNETTLAGGNNWQPNATALCNDGTGTNARFGLTRGIALNQQTGDLYVADHGCNRIRKVTPAGVVSLFAGSGTAGIADGTGASASFNGPSGVAVDAQGNVYVADTNNNRIRKISPTGVVTTLAGSGTIGNINALGLAASFNKPSGIAVDTQGNLFVSDTENHLIRKITTAGLVSTYAGIGTAGSLNGIGTAASFNRPAGIAIATDGTVYVADYQSGNIRKITKPTTRVVRNVGQPIAMNTNMSGLNICICGSWTTKKITYRGAVWDFPCNGSMGVVNNSSAAFNLQYTCSSANATCSTRYEVVITAPTGTSTTVQITNNTNWSYLFNQLGAHTFEFKTYCNDDLCTDSCIFTITSK